MIALLEDAQWALLPSQEILEKIKVLCSDNHIKGTYNLTAFTEVFSPVFEILMLTLTHSYR